jgi:hypothetical protein
MAKQLDWPSAGVRITALDVGANVCPVFDPSSFRVTFVVSEQQGVLDEAHWEFKYLFDVIFEKRELGPFGPAALCQLRLVCSTKLCECV